MAAIIPLKYAATINRSVLDEETAPDLQFKYIDIGSVAGGGSLAIPNEALRFDAAPSRARRLAPTGATAISTVRTYLRAITHIPRCDDMLVFSTGFAIAEPLCGVDHRYLYYACRADPFVEQVVARSSGVSYPAINPSDLACIPIPMHDVERQRRIADFLDDQVARIDNIIAARRTQLVLHAEQLKRLVDDAIDHEGHARTRLALFARIHSGITVDAGRPAEDGVETPYLRVANVQAGSLSLDEIKTIVIPRLMRDRSLLADGDVLMTEGGDIDKLGRGTVWRSEIPGAIHQNHVFAVRPDTRRLLPDYLAYVTACSDARAYFESTGNQTTNLASTSATKVLDLPIPVRDLHEQAEVVALLDRMTAGHRRIDESFHRSVQLLDELKRSLITAAVTGVFDVSSAGGSRVPA